MHGNVALRFPRKQNASGRHGDDIPEPDPSGDDGLNEFDKAKSIYEREDDYRRRRLDRIISPVRNDAFAMGDKTPDARVRTYADIMKEQQLQREMENTMRNIANKKKEEADQQQQQAAATAAKVMAAAAAEATAVGEKRRNRWDQSSDADQ
jgi:splicing factor 3B subunit 1